MIVGIDIGNKGGWVGIGDAAEVVRAGKLPETHDSSDDLELHVLVTEWLLLEATVVYMEGAPGNVRIKGRSNPAGLRSLALWEGLLRGACASRLRVVIVPYGTWKVAVLGRRDATKDDAIALCRSRWPNADQWLIPPGCRVPQDGIADAACIAAYGWGLERFGLTGRAPHARIPGSSRLRR